MPTSTSTSTAPPQSAQSTAHRGVALAAVCLGFYMVLLDGSALNVALPAIQDSVGGSMAALEWVVNAYTIPLASVLLTVGSLADRLGARRVFVLSLIGFTLASLACALSPSIGALITFRVLQGLAAGGMLPTTLTIITRTYPDPVERARAITAWGATGGLGLMSGPLGGGTLTDLTGWRSIFFINVPIGLITLALTRYIPRSQRGPGRHLDIPGQITAVLSLTSVTAGLIEGSSLGWRHPAVVGLIALGLMLALGFIAIELHTREPMLPLQVFTKPAFSASIINGFAFQFGGYGMQFMLALYVQHAWGLTAGQTGLLFLPFSIAWVLGTAVIARKLVPVGPRALLIWGSTCSLLGALTLLFVTHRSDWPILAAGTLLIGLGCGIFSPSLNASAMLAIDTQFVGLGSGILNTARQVGMAIGVALLGGFIALNDTLGLRINSYLIAACFATISILSFKYVPREETP